MARQNWYSKSDKPLKPPTLFFRIFGGLDVRRKLAFLHNIFFIVLATSVYLSVIPLFSHQIQATKQRELQMISQMMAAEIPVSTRQEPQEVSVDEMEGSAEATGLSAEGRQYLKLNPDKTWTQSQEESVFRNGKSEGTYWRVRLTTAIFITKHCGARETHAVCRRWVPFMSFLLSCWNLSSCRNTFISRLTLMLKADEATQLRRPAERND